MHYFRYRPYNEIALKELLYSEIYFASPEECNDPFDSKTFYVFESDREKWVKTIQFAMEHHGISIFPKLYGLLADHICKRCPMTFEEAIQGNLLENFTSNLLDQNTPVSYLTYAIRSFLNLYKPPTRYFVSFSKANSESLMWSHYADKHKGFCLIFKSINNKLNLCPNQNRRNINFVTQNGIAPQMTFGLPEDFGFSNIEYKPKVDLLDAFLHMPVYVTGEIDGEIEKKIVIEKRESHYFQKANCWEYEKESRLVLQPPMPWLFGNHFEFTKQQRLFHFEPSQLVGIIYGARMLDSDKSRIKEILELRKEWGHWKKEYKRIEFRFVEFQAKLSSNERNLDITPISINSAGTIYSTHKDFERLYNEWIDGIGIEMDGASGKKVKIER